MHFYCSLYNMSLLKLFFSLFLMCWLALGVAQTHSANILVENEWEKLTEKDGFLVFSRKNMDTNIKEIRVIFEYYGSMKNTLRVLEDVAGYPNWVYKSIDAKIVDTITTDKYYYYISFDMPFPAWDRDNVILTNIRRDSFNQTVYYDSVAAPAQMPDKKGMVRVQNLESHWKIQQLENGKIRIDYNGLADPGGKIPTWVTNMVITSGPTKSFERFLERVQQLDAEMR